MYCVRHHLHRAFSIMIPLVRSYVHQDGLAYGDSSIGPIYSAPPILQQDHGIGTVLTGFWRGNKPIVWTGGKSLFRESMRIGGKILSVLADNTSPDVKPENIVSKRLSESAKNLIGKMWRVAAESGKEAHCRERNVTFEKETEA
jgi:hypothetical protein